MSENCTHDCSSCGEECSSRITTEKLNELSKVKKVYAVVSGKGGVGKSLITGLLSVLAQRNGLKTAILDADLTGPSIPKMFGLKEKAIGTEMGILPVKTKTGIDVMSINLLLENDTDPVVWRGPVLAGTVKQFYTDVIWQDEDVMFIDMPPGTGDINLTVFQSIKLDGIIIVTSPQQLVSMIVEKAVKMANIMGVKILGIVENMSYFVCPNCGEKHYIYGESHIKEIAKEHGINLVAQVPFDKDFASLCDKGLIELTKSNYLDEFIKEIL
ncbi:MAG TPA: ATP-binding protein [Clostridiales bacterium]|nr:ATP-binding protein [Clostridiales bacterium]